MNIALHDAVRLCMSEGEPVWTAPKSTHAGDPDRRPRPTNKVIHA